MIGLRKKSLSDIVSTFTKTIEDLDNLQNANMETVAENAAKVAELENKSKALTEEAEKAASIQTKLQQLFS